MFAVQKPEAAPHQSPFHDSKQLGSLPFSSEIERIQDTNFNILEDVYGKNGNWRQDKKGVNEELTKIKEYEERPCIEDNRNQVKNVAMGQLKVTRSEVISLSLSEEEEEVRSPPEGAEIMLLEGDTPDIESTRECDVWPTSPLEDNGYASSSLSIDSPDSVPGNIWEDNTTVPVPITSQQEDSDTDGSEVESSSDSESFSITLHEAFQSLQDKEKLKELEKEKHHAQLTMYRRLALLRWIRGLQQRVKDQQNRLQESFDTILDNRKELLRYIQHSCNKIPTKEAA
ncbi:UPF0500 protein C1orf216 homolog [Pelodytes ibericus]